MFLLVSLQGPLRAGGLKYHNGFYQAKRDFNHPFSRFQNLNEAEEAQRKLNRSTQFGDKLMYVNFAEGDRKSKFLKILKFFDKYGPCSK